MKNTIKNLKLFAALKQLREFERLELPFLKSFLDLDIVIEIGYAEEQKHPLTPKQLFLLHLGSLTTVRRRLARLVVQGIVTRRTNAKDRRSDVLAIPSSTFRLLGKYGKLITSTSVSM